METQREKEAISLAEPWKSGVPVQMAAEGDRGSGKAGRGKAGPHRRGRSKGSPEWADWRRTAQDPGRGG